MVFEGNRVRGWIGDDDGGTLGVVQHLAAPHLALQAANAPFDDGIAFRLLELVDQFLAAHLEFAFQMAALEEVIEKRPEQEHDRGLPGHLKNAADP